MSVISDGIGTKMLICWNIGYRIKPHTGWLYGNIIAIFKVPQSSAVKEVLLHFQVVMPTSVKIPTLTFCQDTRLAPACLFQGEWRQPGQGDEKRHHPLLQWCHSNKQAFNQCYQSRVRIRHGTLLRADLCEGRQRGKLWKCQKHIKKTKVLPLVPSIKGRGSFMFGLAISLSFFNIMAPGKRD